MEGDRLYLWPSERIKESGRETEGEREGKREIPEADHYIPKLFAEMHYLEMKPISLKVETNTFCAPFLMYRTALA